MAVRIDKTWRDGVSRTVDYINNRISRCDRPSAHPAHRHNSFALNDNLAGERRTARAIDDGSTFEDRIFSLAHADTFVDKFVAVRIFRPLCSNSSTLRFRKSMCARSISLIVSVASRTSALGSTPRAASKDFSA